MTFPITPGNPPAIDAAIAGGPVAPVKPQTALHKGIDADAGHQQPVETGLIGKAIGTGAAVNVTLLTKQAKQAEDKADKRIIAALDRAGNGDDTLSQVIVRLAIGKTRADDSTRLKAAGLDASDVANMGPASYATMLHAMMSGVTTIDEYVDTDNLCRHIEGKGLSQRVANELIDRTPIDKLFLLNYAHVEDRTFFTPYKTGDVPVLGTGYSAKIFENLFKFQDVLGDVADARSKTAAK